jgi:hypothetical protein
MHMANHTSPRSRKQRYIAGRRTVPRQRKLPLRVPSSAYPASVSVASTSTSSRPSIPSEFTFDRPSFSEPAGDIEDQMDWMSSQLAKLIEDGKRALSKEVVVMSERQEDEEDDGSGQWIDDGCAPIARSRSGSVRSHKRLHSITSPPPAYKSPHTTPSQNHVDASYAGNRSHIPDSSHYSTPSHTSSYREDESSWQSPELRESMEKARRRFLQQRNHAS